MANKSNILGKYDHAKTEGKWAKVWAEKKLDVVDVKGAKKPFYNLMMYPYPSAEGLHVGNMYAFTAADIYGRYKRHQGFDVFEPIGLDGFGIHSENFALKIGKAPKDHAAATEKNFYAQLHKIGCMYDWEKTVETYSPDYYRWTQWIFVQMFKAGLAYRGKSKVNFCPKCKTVLSDEQVISDQCERCSSVVEKKEMEQWFFRITKYADKLLAGLGEINWSEKIKIAQRNWIGRKEWIDISYKIEGTQEQVIVSTTRPDTNFGATFIVLAPEHELVNKLLNSDFSTPDEVKKKIADYVAKAMAKTDQERISEGRKKTGVFTGLYALNQLTGKKMPIWVTDFVLKTVGTGAVIGVPGHDKRDFEFAKEFDLEIVRVVVGSDGKTGLITKIEDVSDNEGRMVNSGFLDGMDIHEATQKIMDYFEEKGWGKRTTRYHLRDWLISRQRYWGAPIPMIYCRDCAAKGLAASGQGPEMAGWFPVPEKDLPVLLPDISDFIPEGNGKGPLDKHEEFYKVKCPNCGGEAKRETDVCDTFLDSSWYELRYPSVGEKNSVKNGVELPWNEEILNKWLPVTMYTGGAEHAVLHLMYFRFVTMVLHDLGYLSFSEPCTNFFAHGLLIKNGAKISKSRGNIINPDEYIEKYGADALRLYLMFMGPVDLGGDFRDSGMEGMRRWVERVYTVLASQIKNPAKITDPEVEKELDKLIIKATGEIEARRYNTVIAKMMEFLNFVTGGNKAMTGAQVGKFLVILSVFAPYLTEELWSFLGEFSIQTCSWPTAGEVVADENAVIAVMVNGKLRSKVSGHTSFPQEVVEDLVRKNPAMTKWLEGKSIKKVVFVPGKVINFVVA